MKNDILQKSHKDNRGNISVGPRFLIPTLILLSSLTKMFLSTAMSSVCMLMESFRRWNYQNICSVSSGSEAEAQFISEFQWK